MSAKKDTRLAGLEAALRHARHNFSPECECSGCISRYGPLIATLKKLIARERGKRNG